MIRVVGSLDEIARDPARAALLPQEERAVLLEWPVRWFLLNRCRRTCAKDRGEIASLKWAEVTAA